MKISKKDWQNYIARLRKINDRAAEKVASFIETHDCSTPEGMKLLIDYSHAVATKYGEGAAELSCQMLDAVAEASGVYVPAAEPAATATYGEIAKTIYGTMASTKDPKAIGAAVGRSVKLASVDTLQQNALRDGAEWAWIPQGDTCPFCLMLASRGWVKASKKAIKNGHAEHIHNNCDCTYCVRYDGETTVEGYDPDALYDEYKNAGDTKWERLNALRRKHYAANKDYINAQKRAAYALKMTGGRILDPNGDYEEKWAKSYYEEIRHKSTDCRKIAERIGVPEKEIRAIKNYLFYNKSWYNDLSERYERFAPDVAIAQSWQRLAEGKKIMPHDRTLINHELYEMKLKRDNPGITHSEAHTKATHKYNYQGEAEEYYADLRKSKENGK